MKSKLYPITIVSDCGGQAMMRMQVCTASLHTDAQVFPCLSAHPIEAGGNIVDAIDSFRGERRGAILCNNAPRQASHSCENGSSIVYGQLGEIRIVSTSCVLGLVKHLYPELCVCKIDVDAFVQQFGDETRGGRFQFRGLEVIPLLLQRLRDGTDLSAITTSFDHFPEVRPSVWLVDDIWGGPTNLKLTTLRQEVAGFEGGRIAVVRVQDQHLEIPCYERLADIPKDELGLYEGSSGRDNRRFLEIAVMGSSAALRLNVHVGDEVEIMNIK